MGSLFITGTDTSSGKTFVTAGMIAAMRMNGIPAVPAKPVQTGCVNGISPDLEFILKTAGIRMPAGEAEALCPWKLEPECSPHLAAELAGVRIDVPQLAEGMRHLARRYGTVVAEGAGGILVPLGQGCTILDLIRELGWPVVLVAANRLGAINHTLLSIGALRASGIHLAGVVMNCPASPNELIRESNVRAVTEYSGVRVLGQVPFSPGAFPFQAFLDIHDSMKGTLPE